MKCLISRTLKLPGTFTSHKSSLSNKHGKAITPFPLKLLCLFISQMPQG